MRTCNWKNLEIEYEMDSFGDVGEYTVHSGNEPMDDLLTCEAHGELIEFIIAFDAKLNYDEAQEKADALGDFLHDEMMEEKLMD